MSFGFVEKEILDTKDPSIVKIRQKLYPEEEKMPLRQQFV